MARSQLFEFKYDGDTVRVFTAESSSDVYYSINGGSSKSAGMRWNESTGYFKSVSGSLLSHDEAKAKIRMLMSN